jgi:pilus assembly protein Flp/PilA
MDTAFGESHRDPTLLGIFNQRKSKEKIMKSLILESLNRLHNDEAGQGIVEYMLIIALVAFAATAGMSSLASGVNSAMTKIGSILGVYIK